MFDPQKIAADFPILSQQVHGKRLVYLDSAASSQKPQVVIDAISEYYQTANANVHRGVHLLSDKSTGFWEESRKTIAQFFGARPSELIMTRNTTEGLNGVVYGWGLDHVGAGDVIITTLLEHHANVVPWQQLAERVGARVEYVSVDAEGRLQLSELDALLQTHGAAVKLIAVTHVSNALGTVAPVEKIVEIVKKQYGSAAQVGTANPNTGQPKTDVVVQQRPLLVLDGAQSAPHLPLNFATLGFDVLVASGHKMLGPMGAGVLLVKQSLLETGQFKPWLFGGGMISEVATDGTTFHPDIAERFTPGTPDVASAVGLAAACIYLSDLGMQNVAAHDQELVQYIIEKLSELPQVELIGPTTPLREQTQTQPSGTSTDEFFERGKHDRVGSVSFLYHGVHAHDVAQVLDSEGVAVRSGHHCTMPLHTHCNWQATLRVSFHVYTTRADIDALVAGLEKVAIVFGK